MSKIVNNDVYNLTLSAYIHNNANDLPDLSGKEDLYLYSSYGIYTGLRKDNDRLLDTQFILQYFSSNINTARERYINFVKSFSNSQLYKKTDDSIKLAWSQNEYLSGKVQYIRYPSIPELLKKVEKFLDYDIDATLQTKYMHKATVNKAFAVYLIYVLCGVTYKQICKFIGNISISRVSDLSNKGFELLQKHKLYSNVFRSLTSV